MLWWLEHFSHKGKLRQLELFSPEKRRLKGYHFTVALQYLKGSL